MADYYKEVTWGTEGGDYPPELLKNMRPDDEVMAYIKIAGKSRGCLSKKVKDTGDFTFLAITRERIVGTVEMTNDEGKVKTVTVATFNIPIVKVTSLETSSKEKDESGCLSKSKTTDHYLTINAQGEDMRFYTGGDSTVNDQFIRSFLEISDYF